MKRDESKGLYLFETIFSFNVSCLYRQGPALRWLLTILTGEKGIDLTPSYEKKIKNVNNPPYKDRGPTANQSREAIKIIEQTC